MNQARRFADTAFGRPIFVLKTTGGAAAQLASDPFLAAEAIDADIAEQVWTRARRRLESTEVAFDQRRHELEQKIVPIRDYADHRREDRAGRRRNAKMVAARRRFIGASGQKWR
jgi:hypothetical protein